MVRHLLTHVLKALPTARISKISIRTMEKNKKVRLKRNIENPVRL